jgi:hypothetical protein
MTLLLSFQQHTVKQKQKRELHIVESKYEAALKATEDKLAATKQKLADAKEQVLK